MRVILAGLVGNVIEWYDFALYGYFANVIGQQLYNDVSAFATDANKKQINDNGSF